MMRNNEINRKFKISKENSNFENKLSDKKRKFPFKES